MDTENSEDKERTYLGDLKIVSYKISIWEKVFYPLSGIEGISHCWCSL